MNDAETLEAWLSACLLRNLERCVCQKATEALDDAVSAGQVCRGSDDGDGEMERGRRKASGRGSVAGQFDGKQLCARDGCCPAGVGGVVQGTAAKPPTGEKVGRQLRELQRARKGWIKDWKSGLTSREDMLWTRTTA